MQPIKDCNIVSVIITRDDENGSSTICKNNLIIIYY